MAAVNMAVPDEALHAALAENGEDEVQQGEDEAKQGEVEAKQGEDKEDEERSPVQQWHQAGMLEALREDGDERKPWDWSEVCSKHLMHIEKRLMEQEFLAHETMRQLMVLLSEWSPAPRGDFSWLHRRMTGVGVRYMRQLVKYYLRAGEEKKEFIKNATSLVRLIVEEAWHRTLLAAEGPLRKSAMCTLANTMRDCEADTLGQDACDFGMFWTFSEANVMRVATKVGKGEMTSIEDMPSWQEVKQLPEMKLEAFSLMLVRVQPAAIKMSRDEVRAVLETHLPGVPLTEDEVRELEENFPHEGPSAFAKCFDR